MQYFDTHAHYNDEAYKDNLEEILLNNKNANVRIYCKCSGIIVKVL